MKTRRRDRLPRPHVPNADVTRRCDHARRPRAFDGRSTRRDDHARRAVTIARSTHSPPPRARATPRPALVHDAYEDHHRGIQTATTVPLRIIQSRIDAHTYKIHIPHCIVTHRRGHLDRRVPPDFPASPIACARPETPRPWTSTRRSRSTRPSSAHGARDRSRSRRGRGRARERVRVYDIETA